MLILLDRDGVINSDLSPHGVTSLSMLDIYPFAGTAIRQLNNAGFRVAIVTNQSAIGKGLLSIEELGNIHAALCDQLQVTAGARIDAIYFCPDHPDNPTYRRKPQGGMLREAMTDFNATPALTVMVGDDVRDIQAAISAGCQPYLVLTGKGEHTRETLKSSIPPIIAEDAITICNDLLDVSMHILLKST